RMAEIDTGRAAFAAGTWESAYCSLSAADRTCQLEPGDRELLARSAYLLGKDDEYVAGLEQAHNEYLSAGDLARAVRCAFWIGHNRLFRGEPSAATGWFSRARRLLDSIGDDCVERG